MFLFGSQYVIKRGGRRLAFLPMIHRPAIFATNTPLRHFSAFGQQFDPKKDYWKILGVSPGSNEKQIKL